MAKSYWQSMRCSTPRDKEAIKLFFAPLCDGMEPESCDILCDTQTDRERKIRAIMITKTGERKRATRTLGRKQFSVSLEAA